MRLRRSHFVHVVVRVQDVEQLLVLVLPVQNDVLQIFLHVYYVYVVICQIVALCARIFLKISFSTLDHGGNMSRNERFGKLARVYHGGVLCEENLRRHARLQVIRMT